MPLNKVIAKQSSSFTYFVLRFRSNKSLVGLYGFRCMAQSGRKKRTGRGYTASRRILNRVCLRS